MVYKKKVFTVVISHKQFGQRLDQALTKLLPNYSRMLIKKWIINQCVFVNNTIWDKPKKKILGGEVIVINSNIETDKCFLAQSQNINLNIVYEDENILIINKPRGLVIHPGAGNLANTMLNALLHYYPPAANIPRSGIVHRLDKDTTGLVVVAKTAFAYTRLVKLLQLRKITREYEAIAIGHIIAGGIIDKPIWRHPIKRTHMSVNSIGKPAVTHYHVIERFRGHTRLRVRLETGRTHQIRVHMAHIDHPLVGDQTYGGRHARVPIWASKKLTIILRKFDRQALHATELRFNHPVTGNEMKLHSPVPQDMVELIEAMREDFKENQK